MTRERTMFGALDHSWRPCPPGELQQLAGRLRLRRWAGVAFGTAVALLVAAAVALSGLQAVTVLVPDWDSWGSSPAPCHLPTTAPTLSTAPCKPPVP